MKNQEIAKALKLIAEGFSTLAVAFEGAETNLTPVTQIAEKVANEVQKETPVKEVVEEPKQEVNAEDTKETTNSYTLEELEAKTYNEVKAIAKEVGVKAVGSKKVIIDNIMATMSVEPIEDTTTDSETTSNETVEETSETPVDAIETDEDEVDIQEVDTEEDEDEEVDIEGEKTLYDEVVENLEGYSDEELADILSDIGISPKGKRQALLAKIVQAIEEGKLEWGEEESEEPQETAKEEPKTEELETEEFVGTEARRVACEKEIDRIEEDLEKGNISHKEIIMYLKSFYNGKYTSQGVDSDIDEYIAIQCDLIDDEGNKHDLADPYYVGDDVFCCGQKLKDVDDDLFCEICGTTYQA